MSTKLLCFFVVATLTVFGAESSPLSSFFPWPSSGGQNSNLNWVMDSIIKSMSQQLIANQGDQLEIPESLINSTRDVNILWMNFATQAVSSGNGVLKNISSVVRVSDAGIRQETESGSIKDIVLKADLKLNDFEMSYPSVNAKVSFLSYTGGLSISCPNNVFEIEVQISSGSSCTAKLLSATIKELSGCKIELKESGFLNFIKKLVFSTAIGKVEDQIKAVESVQLPSIITPVLEKHNICKFLDPSSIAV